MVLWLHDSVGGGLGGSIAKITEDDVGVVGMSIGFEKDVVGGEVPVDDGLAPVFGVEVGF